MIYCTFLLSTLFHDADSRAQFMWYLVKWEDCVGLVAKNSQRHGHSMYVSDNMPVLTLKHIKTKDN